MRKALLWLEFTGLFLVVPLVLYVWRRDFADRIIVTLVLVSVLCLGVLLLDPSFDRRRLWKVEGFGVALRCTLGRFLPAAIVVGIVFALLQPERLFEFPRGNPRLWLVVMVLYPVLSVYPQEIIFRTYLFHRYRDLLPPGWVTILVSGAAFGLAHLFFANWVAPLMTAVGGVLFARTYHETRSTLPAVVEHALWGDFVFTIGLGWYFWGGSIS